MNYAWNREPKLNIRSSHKPSDSKPLSGLALIVDQGVGRVYIQMDDQDIERIGKKMPYGLGYANPGYLRVIKKHGHYDIMCSYLDKSKTVALWKSDKLPNWVKRIKYNQPSL